MHKHTSPRHGSFGLRADKEINQVIKIGIMDNRPTLSIKEIQNTIRQVGINPNYWYPVAWTDIFKKKDVIPVTIWNQNIVVYRTTNGHLNALEDACLHKGVELHKGEVQQDRIVCPYHGWEFDNTGSCVRIPYLQEGKKCPSARIRTFPVQERYQMVWLFPGNLTLAEQTPLPVVPEFDDPDWLMVKIPGHFMAHFSTCNENTMDVFHGHLHKGLQGWFDPELIKLDSHDSGVVAEYRVSYKGRLAKLLGLAKSAEETYQRTVSIEYAYPHYQNRMGELSSLYLMRLPVGPAETRSFSLMFLKPGIPSKFWQPYKEQLARLLWRFLLKRFLDQDKEMIESEQTTYNADPQARKIEINPAIMALRRVIYDQYQSHISATEATPEKRTARKDKS